MAKGIKKVFSIVADIVIVLIIILAVVVSIASFTSKSNDGVPNLFGYTAFSIQTDSMKSTINPGDYILGEKCDATNLNQGDIITFYTIIDGKKVINTHRIIDKTEDAGTVYYQTQGDNKVTNPTPDENLVAPGDVISKYDGIRIPVLGFVMTFLGTQLGFFIVILLPVLLFTILQIYKLIKTVMHNQKVALLQEVQNQPSEEMKQAVIAEFLAKKQEEEGPKESITK